MGYYLAVVPDRSIKTEGKVAGNISCR